MKEKENFYFAEVDNLSIINKVFESFTDHQHSAEI